MTTFLCGTSEILRFSSISIYGGLAGVLLVVIVFVAGIGFGASEDFFELKPDLG